MVKCNKSGILQIRMPLGHRLSKD